MLNSSPEDSWSRLGLFLSRDVMERRYLAPLRRPRVDGLAKGGRSQIPPAAIRRRYLGNAAGASKRSHQDRSK
jgi:hypothetical protein